MYKAIDVARYVVQKCIDLGHPITNVQLQQLLAYIQQDWLDEGLLVFIDDVEWGSLARASRTFIMSTATMVRCLLT